jgi:GMP synthase (glutamine-hydrolysing)
VRFLLLQARNPGDSAGPHEAEAFRDELDLKPEQLQIHDLLGGRPAEAVLDEVDCVLVGGSGEFGVNDVADHPWLVEFIDFMGELANRGAPTFASCFGFQALVVAGGGEVVPDKSRAEVGTFELFTTEAGAEDPVFRFAAPTFHAQLGHKDHATRLPSGAVHLAGSQRSPFQALMIEGTSVYATQFHPELSMVRNRERFMRYLEAYSEPDMVDTPEEVLAKYRDTTRASDLLRSYVRDVLPGAISS